MKEILLILTKNNHFSIGTIRFDEINIVYTFLQSIKMIQETIPQNMDIYNNVFWVARFHFTINKINNHYCIEIYGLYNLNLFVMSFLTQNFRQTKTYFSI